MPGPISDSYPGPAGPEWDKAREAMDDFVIFSQEPALYMRKNRCVRLKTRPLKTRLEDWPPTIGYGPIRMEARKTYFDVLLEIQEAAGVTLTTAEDVAFIHDCWERKVYPRGWSEADELVQPPETGMFGTV